MAATLMQLRRLVRSRVGIPAVDDFFTDSVVDDSINLALQTIDAEYHWPWNDAVDAVTVSSAHPDIIPPADWRATRAVFFGEGELASISPVDLLTWNDTTSDIPTVWAPIGDVIAVRPTPSSDTELRHYYYRQTAWLTDDNDTPRIPEQYGGAIVAKAAALLAARESSAADAARHGGEFVDWINRMRRDVKPFTGPSRVRVRPGGWI